MKDIYGNNIISNININKKFIGEVVFIEDWEEFKTVKVFIPELFPLYRNSKYLIETTESLANDNINLINDNKLKTDIGIICKQVMINKEFIKPEVGDKVVVEFVDNDLKKSVFYMMNWMW